MHMFDLPPELFEPIMEHLAYTLPICRILRLRLVCKTFDTSLVAAIINTEAVERAYKASAPVWKLRRYWNFRFFGNRMPEKWLLRLLLRHAQKRGEDDKSIVCAVQEVARRLVQEQQRIVNERTGKQEVEESNTEQTVEEKEEKEETKHLLDEQQTLEAVCVSLIFLHSNTIIADILDPLDREPETRRAQLCLNTAAWLGNIALFDTFYARASHKHDVYGSGPYNHLVGPLQRPLCAAVHQNHKAMVQHLLKLGARPWVDEAFRCGNLPMAQLILSARHPNNIAREIRLYALQEAAKGGDVETLNFVLTHPAFAPSKSSYTNSLLRRALCDALYHAVVHGHEHLVPLLLDRGADPNGSTYISPLATAARLGHLRIVKTLLARGAEWHSCIKCRYLDTRKRDAPCSDPHSAPVLLKAVARGWTGITHALLDADARMLFSPGALKAAAEKGCVDAARALLERGFDVEREHPDLDPRKGGLGREAVFAACQQGQVSMVKMLAEWGCDIRGRFGEEESMIVEAKRCGHDNVVDVLVELGVEVPEGFEGLQRHLEQYMPKLV
ncbi:uncharacterized protein K452DRAFT_322005 [Aplosporella prunicola CBS 121167]|uniref:F-box domain-containing protein n=1 Tax=Aplosporella prunicola CBS 121167 TaxID=1176127 RepID=A0A6A6AZK1_9PEZI|nr:uncharacterized protein K452DRAFT_322005 [Aplosporella prunicola CBS 121167]KAF2137076.1 hypothetical protein K452DRAFT_322005 [Aplosporella prunicola CBS 121167]